jgi:hypothetical protein
LKLYIKKTLIPEKLSKDGKYVILAQIDFISVFYV